jgi:VTC domain-containing protein
MMEHALARDARMTAHRREAKYLVVGERARVVAAELERRLPAHRHRGAGANQLPAAHHYTTTIYFDTAGRALYHAAVDRGESHLKLRAKEYYDVHPALHETATDPRQLVRYQRVLWLELKHREGAHTGKRRLGIPKMDIPAFFTEGRITEAMVRIQEPAYGRDAQDVLAAVAALCKSLGEPLRADSLVNYRRAAWQDPAGDLRVTIDTGLALYAPPADLWQRDWALVRQTLGPSVAVEPRRVIEVKTLGDPPTWLDELIGEAPVAFSKFEAASRAVFDRRCPTPSGGGPETLDSERA